MAVNMLVDGTALDTALTATANAIRTKGGTSAQIAFDDETGFAAAIAALPSGGGEIPVENDVNFWDYDGTLIAAYSAAEFADLASIPDNPTHPGLTAQGWNWTLANAKAYVAAHGCQDIGQNYTPTDGKTKLICNINEYCLTVCFRVCPNGTISVDWGDNSAPTTITGTSLTTQQHVYHTYASADVYEISITVVLGSFAFTGKVLSKNDTAGTNESRVYLATIEHIIIGDSCLIGDNAFQNCSSLKTVTFPITLTAINQYAFSGCVNLRSVVIPPSVTAISGRETFAYGYSLSNVSIPKEVSSSLGRSLFASCRKLKRLVLPETITSIGISSFDGCSAIHKIVIPVSSGSVGNSGFSGCSSLENITLPDDITSFGSYGFSSCEALKFIDLPASLTNTGTYLFNNCYALTSITIPSAVTTIGGNTFANCYGLREIHFKPTTPPSVGNANAFSNLQTDCIIYVPSGYLNAYKTASNYPNPANYTYVEE